MPGFTLSSIPGFADQPDSTLAHDKTALGIKLGRINSNAAFGMARLEVFSGVYSDGETVPVPVSTIDGYIYSRDELYYLWAAQNTGNPKNNWASAGPPYTMWYVAYEVDQTTGLVSCITGYRGNQDHKDRQMQSQDGVLQVWIIAQRQRSSLTVASTPSFTYHADAGFATDKPLTESLAQTMNQSAKAGVINFEVIYMGEFAHGATVPQPVSPADGHTYAYADCVFQTCLRWTMDDDGGSPPNAKVPDIAKGQLKDWSSSVNASTGAVTISILYESSGSTTYHTGRIAVFAFCRRSSGTLAVVADQFAEISDETFWAGESLRADTVKQLEHNIREAFCSPEIFGPYSKANGTSISAPTSPVDGYTYSAAELMYIWDYENTGPDASDNHDRMVLDSAFVDGSGNVGISNYRFQSGASDKVLQHDGTLRVIVFAKRSAEHTYAVQAPVAPGAVDLTGSDPLDPLANGISSPLNNQASINPAAIGASATIVGAGSTTPVARVTVTGGTIYLSDGSTITVPSSGPNDFTTWNGSTVLNSTNYNGNIVWKIGTGVARQEFNGSATTATKAAAFADGNIPINYGINFTTPDSGGSGGGGGGGGSCFTGAVEADTADGPTSMEEFKSFPERLAKVKDHDGRLREAVLIEHKNFCGDLILFDRERPDWGVVPTHGFREGEGWIAADEKFKGAPRVRFCGTLYSLSMLDSKCFDDANFQLANGDKPHNMKVL